MSQSNTNAVPEGGEAADISPEMAKRVEAILAAQYSPRLLVAREIELMAGVLKLASKMAADFVKRHSGGCRCEDREWHDQAYPGMQAVRYGCRLMMYDLQSIGGHAPKLNGDCFGDDLRRLANLSDRIDKAAEAAGAEPTCVVEGK
jgi:hypothetical protein